MPEMRFTEIPTVSLDPRVKISPSASESGVWLFFLPMSFKIIIYHSHVFFFFLFFVFFFDTLRRITTFSERHSVFLVVVISDVTSELYSSDVTFHVACELS